jgi:hypothetical protein
MGSRIWYSGYSGFISVFDPRFVLLILFAKSKIFSRAMLCPLCIRVYFFPGSDFIGKPGNPGIHPFTGFCRNWKNDRLWI